MELTAIWDILRRRKWILIQAMFVVGLVAVAVTYFSVSIYDASAKILLMKAKKSVIDIGSVGSQLASIIETSADVDVNKVIAASREYVDKMVIRLQLRDEDGNLINASRPEAEALSTWKARFSPIPYISVTQYRDTNILVIHGNSPDGEEAAMMANTLAGIMVERNQELMRAEYKNAKDFLQAQIDRVKKKYESALKDLAEFQKREHTIDLGVETKLASEKMMELLKEKEDNIIDLSQVRAKIGYLKRELAKMSVTYLPAAALKASPQLTEIKRRLMELRLRLADASTELTPDHPEMVALKEKIALASNELKKEIEVYRKTAPELLDLQKQKASLEAHLKGVNADIDRYLKALGGIPDKAYQKANIDKEVAAARQTYSDLLQFLYQLGIAEARTLAEIRIIEKAVRPPEPTGPTKVVNGMLGSFVGLIFGLGLAFFLEYLDNTIKTSDELKPFAPVEVIGTVPRFDPGEPGVISTKDPNDPICEAYRTIRTFIKGAETPIHALLVTSGGPGEGKSTTVVNLGISMVREAKQVVLVDTDIRRPRLHTYFGLRNDHGLAEYLLDGAPLDEVLQPTAVDGLQIVTSGRPFHDPGRLIESEGIGRLIAGLKRRCDMMIPDSAPVLVKSDALVLARHMDDCLVVLESGKTTKKAVQGVLNLMARAGISPLGLVLNRVPIRKGTHVFQQYYAGHYGPEFSPGGST